MKIIPKIITYLDSRKYQRRFALLIIAVPIFLLVNILNYIFDVSKAVFIAIKDIFNFTTNFIKQFYKYVVRIILYG